MPFKTVLINPLTDNHVSLARSMARKSQERQRVGCIVSKRTRVVSTGFNQAKTHPLIESFPYEPHCRLHAEMHACLGVKNSILKGCAVYVIRILKNDDLALSRPCKGCQKYLQSVGIRRVFYSLKDGCIACLEL